MMAQFDITLADVYQARRRITPYITRTPLMPSVLLGERAGCEVFIKLENVQHTGAFKLRGAANAMLGLSDEQKARGVITVSSGNHGRAVSYISGKVGIKATICLAENVPANKVEGIRRYGAEIVSRGAGYDEAVAVAEALHQERQLTYLSPFDDPAIIAGQGTIGLEIMEDLPDVDTLVVPLSGGGLISGVALAAKSINPAVRIVGVSMARAPVMIESLKAGQPVDLPEEPTLADALVGGLGDHNRYTFKMCQALIDQTVVVSEEEIARAMAFMLHGHHQVVEGGGAVGIAALMSGQVRADKAALVVSGGNVDIPLLMDIAAQYAPEG